MNIQNIVKTHIPDKYAALPSWVQLKQRDPHDYKLRTKEEFLKEQKQNPPCFSVEVEYNYFPQAIEEKVEMNRKIKLWANMIEMKLTKKQKERLITLLGPRYKNSDRFAITCEMYPEMEDNLNKGFEMLRELYWEAKRAP